MIASLSSRSNYSTLNDFVYLNQASLGLISRRSILEMHKFLDDVARHGNSKMTDDEEVEFLDSLGSKASSLFNCAKENLGILSSASEMLNQLPYLILPNKKSKVILVSTDFPALYRPWLAYSERNKFKLKFVEDNKNQDLTETIINSLCKDTSVVIVSYVQFSTGSKIDVVRLRRSTKRFNIKLIVDVTQAAGALVVDSKIWNCDAIVCSGYKWLGGHGGVGLAVLSEELISKTPLTPGWMGAENPFSISHQYLSLSKTARRFTQSTMSYVSIKGLEVSIKELLEMKIQNIEKHSKDLKTIFLDKLKDTSWNVFHDNNIDLSSSNIICISNDKKNLKEASNLLFQNNIICSYRNNHLRISIAHFNNENDIEKLFNFLCGL